jgi:hypothetical protein
MSCNWDSERLITQHETSLKNLHRPESCGVVQYSFQAEAHYCGKWWHDIGKDRKVDLTKVCYTDQRDLGKVDNGVPVLSKVGCAHLAPVSSPPSRRMLRSSASGAARSLSETIDSSADLAGVSNLYNQGREVDWARRRWYGCRNTTAEGSAARAECHTNAIRLNFGLDAKALTLMLHLIQVCAAIAGSACPHCSACRLMRQG